MDRGIVVSQRASRVRSWSNFLDGFRLRSYRGGSSIFCMGGLVDQGRNQDFRDVEEIIARARIARKFLEPELRLLCVRGLLNRA